MIRILLLLTLMPALLLSFFILENQSSLESSEFHKRISSLNAAEKSSLALFFLNGLHNYTFAYTLFGEKPCSMICYPNNKYLTRNPINESSLLVKQQLDQGWSVWKKVIHGIKENRFTIRKICSSSLNILFLIDKRQTLAILQNELSYIQQLLNTSLQANEILDKICDPNDPLLEHCPENSRVLGLLLGYGRKNSETFARRNELPQQINLAMLLPAKENFDHLNAMSLFFVKDSFSFVNHSSQNEILKNVSLERLKQDINEITETFENFELVGSGFFVEQFQSPIFMAVQESKETKDLLQKYTHSRKKLLTDLKEPYLDAILAAWFKS